jgi:homoserine O-acetyltransferase
MNSHDLGRGRESVEAALASIQTPTLVLGLTTDRLFPLSGQQLIAEHLGGELIGGELIVIESEFGHDGFLIEVEAVSAALRKLLEY